MKIYPVPGRLVRDPITSREVTQSVEVPDHDPFWLRRIADGDVSEQPVATAQQKGAE